MSVLESRKAAIVLSYRNCELLCCHLDGYHEDSAALLRRLDRVEEALRQRPARRWRVWYNVDESRMGEEAAGAIVQSIGRCRENVERIAFIGLRGVDKRRFLRALRQVPVPFACFTDAEEAKGWLVS